MLVENVSLWCKRLSKKVKITTDKKQNNNKKKRTQKAAKHNVPIVSSTLVPSHASVFHVHKQKYIHSSHFGTFFVHEKLQKAPLNRPVMTLAAVSSLTRRRSTSTKLSYSSSKYRCRIHSSAYEAAPTPSWSRKKSCFVLPFLTRASANSPVTSDGCVVTASSSVVKGRIS